MEPTTFFEQQADARRRTWLLLLVYCVGVTVIILGVYFAVMATWIYLERTNSETAGLMGYEISWWQPSLFLAVTFMTLLVVAGGSLYKVIQLSGGGESFAKMLGLRRIYPSTRDRDERKLLNVVEEMAIASGVPVPPVYVMRDEAGINAFAAGYKPKDAVIGVTRGCLRLLSRDELQGVVAHEFSHILNGDMRLNIRLMAILHGILIIAMTGYFLLRISVHGGHSRRSYDRDSRGGGAMPILILGVLLVVLGYVGVFFGKLIKSAISRQREFLADASAVQFTRNPLGITGALKKIGGFVHGSAVGDANAEEMSHFFFANGVGLSLSSLLATHPPLPLRIKRIDPHFSGQFVNITPEDLQFADESAAEADPQQPQQAAPQGVFGPLEPVFKVTPQEIVDRVGTMTPDHLDFARMLIASIPLLVMNQAHDGYGARALIYCLLLDRQPEIRDRQLEYLRNNTEKAIAEEIQKLLAETSKLSPEHRLPLIDIAIPALKGLPDSEYLIFRKHVDALVRADDECSLFEYALQRTLLRHVEAGRDLGEAASKPSQTRSSSWKADAAELVLQLAYLSNNETQKAQQAAESGLSTLGVTLADPQTKGSITTLHKVLGALENTPDDQREVTLKACVAAVAADDLISVEEAEIIRAIADALNCPVPPFLPNQVVPRAS